jgi:DNA invertase Pin-like site-specific DNA recombinase
MKKEPEPGTGTGSRASVCRCAIYTRKSTEEGLNQPFNTLEAQREAAEAYILSQRHLGWSVVADRYDDGGYTGGNLERPAIQKLLTDFKAGKIDCVVIYKVDRLSRSLLDFARLMEIFEQHGVSLVSVTQPLNTTSSLGRLTLNILLSFAQFEREIIADRTRDKMSAARRKGKWVGGIPVLGYDVALGGGKLVVNHEEARHVRAVFALYLELQSVDKLQLELQKRGWLNKRRRRRAGHSDAGRPFTKAGLERLLANVVYIGQVRFQGGNYAGEQAGIIEQAVWRQAQELLAQECVGRPPRSRVRSDRGDGLAGAAAQKASSERVPRIARLMALALKFEQMMREGVVHNYAVLAALGQVSRSRLTQVMNLLNLAPDIQEQILFLTWETAEQRGIHERSVRQLSSQLSWAEQRARWQVLISEYESVSLLD